VYYCNEIKTNKLFDFSLIVHLDYVQNTNWLDVSMY